MKKTLLPITASLALCSSLFAGSKEIEVEITQPEDSWEFGIAPYLWASGISGTVGLPGLPASDVDASFGDIWDNLDFAGFLAFEANKGRFKSFLDFQYVNLGADADIGPLDVSLDVEQVRLELGAGYEVYATDTTSVIFYGAVMYNYVDNTISGIPNTISESDGWVDPAIGLKLKHSLTDKWFVKLAGEYGGFGVSSDETWQALAGLGYNINDKWAILGGYRHQSIDYSKDGFIYDTETTGPYLGAKYSF